MKKVLVISKSVDDPSAYYRLIQYLGGRKGVHCAQVFSKRQYQKYYGRKETVMAKAAFGMQAWVKIFSIVAWDILLYHSEMVIINRKIFPRYCPKLIGRGLRKYLGGKYVVWDFDDNIFANGEIGRVEAKIYEETADRVVVTNEYLKGLLCPGLQGKTDLLPTTDRDFEKADIRSWNRIRKKLFCTNIHMLWVGTRGNLHYLDDVVPQLDQAAGEMGGRTVTLFVVCNMPYKKKARYLHIKNVRWARDRTLRLMPRMHIGLMPLAENGFTKGKGACKAVQYIGAGLPTIASPVGFNCSVVRDGENGCLADSEWGTCMKRLAQSYEVWEQYSLRARASWERDFPSRRNVEYWERMVQ